MESDESLFLQLRMHDYLYVLSESEQERIVCVLKEDRKTERRLQHSFCWLKDTMS